MKILVIIIMIIIDLIASSAMVTQFSLVGTAYAEAGRE